MGSSATGKKRSRDPLHPLQGASSAYVPQRRTTTDPEMLTLRAGASCYRAASFSGESIRGSTGSPATEGHRPLAWTVHEPACEQGASSFFWQLWLCVCCLTERKWPEGLRGRSKKWPGYQFKLKLCEWMHTNSLTKKKKYIEDIYISICEAVGLIFGRKIITDFNQYVSMFLYIK